MKTASCAVATSFALLMSACAGTRGAPPQSIANVDRVRESPGAKLAATRAPQAYAMAEQRRKEAIAANADGDTTAASLLAERAVAGYSRAVVLARAADAQHELDDAQALISKADSQFRELSAGRTNAERDAQDLETKLKVAREALLPSTSGATTPDREAARLTAARSIAVQGALLCGAARLIAAADDTLTNAESALAKVTTQLDAATTKGPVPIDAAARGRAACLAVLTRARRTAKDAVTGQADALLAELSTANMLPTRDERGVIVTLHDAFAKSVTPTADAKQRLEELGRVAAAHAGVGVQIVNHDSTPDGVAIGQSRADAAASIVIGAGASKEHTKAETAGTRAPLVDPRDTARKGRNARLEIVFVTPGN